MAKRVVPFVKIGNRAMPFSMSALVTSGRRSIPIKLSKACEFDFGSKLELLV